MSFQTLEAVATRSRVVRVDLLPPEIGQARRDRRVRLALGGALAAVVGVCAGAYVITLGHVAVANDDLAVEQARTAALQAEQAPYAEVPKILAEVETAVSVQQAVSAGDVPWYSYLDQLAAVSPTELSFTSVTMQVTGTSTDATGAVADPLQQPGVASVTVAGQTTSQTKVADWLDAVAGIPGVADPTLSSSTFDPGTDVVTFDAGLTLTDAALSAQR
ncbi:PilN domain-containing protein [Kineococcus terrestris]|uniref:PilN domain-containing protein n=1 Tax=Kineococcus terrestris TaxID=2044856 RepID=UPI0034DB486D